MGLAVGDVVALTYGATYASQQIRYNLHYQVTVAGSSTSPELDLQAMADNFAAPGTNTLTAALQACHTDDFNFDFVSAQRVSPNRTIRLVKLASFPGTIATAGLPPNVAITITKRTLTAGRRGIGSLHLTGVDPAVVALGEIVTLTTYAALLPLLTAGRSVGAVTMSVDPGLFNPTRPPTYFSRLFDAAIQTTTRVMRRRTVRVGI